MIPESARTRLIELGNACLAARSNRTEHGKALTDLDAYLRWLRRNVGVLRLDPEADLREQDKP
jgi:hypothetical protein